MLNQDSKSAKILIIRFSAFGDVVQTLSVPTALKQALSQSEIHWVTRKDMTPLLTQHPAIDKVWAFDKTEGLRGLLKLAFIMRAEKFTHIYDAHNNSRSRLIAWILKPSILIPIIKHPKFIRRSIKRWKRFLLFQFRVNTFEMPFSGQRDLLEPLTAWGVKKDLPPTPQIFATSESRKKAAEILGNFAGSISLAPSAAHFLKRWPKEYWQELILLCPEQKFVLLGGPQDAFIEDIVAVAPQRVLNLAGQCSLGVSVSVVAQSSLIISNDTWILHAGEQLGIHTVALMGPAPFGFPSRPTTKIMQLDLPCRPCSKHGQGPCINKKKYHQCLVDITPREIAAEIKNFMDLQQ